MATDQLSSLPALTWAAGGARPWSLRCVGPSSHVLKLQLGFAEMGGEGHGSLMPVSLLLVCQPRSSGCKGGSHRATRPVPFPHPAIKSVSRLAARDSQGPAGQGREAGAP